MTVKAKELAELQKAAGLKTMPTTLTHDLRIAVSGKGPRAYEWQDKPHRLLYDACTEIEKLEAEVARLRESVLLDRAFVENEALCRAIEQQEQFKREVSDKIEALLEWPSIRSQAIIVSNLSPFILPKPDHIRGAALDIGVSWGPNDSESFRAALAKRGGRIVWENEP